MTAAAAPAAARRRARAASERNGARAPTRTRNRVGRCRVSHSLCAREGRALLARSTCARTCMRVQGAAIGAAARSGAAAGARAAVGEGRSDEVCAGGCARAAAAAAGARRAWRGAPPVGAPLRRSGRSRTPPHSAPQDDMQRPPPSAAAPQHTRTPRTLSAAPPQARSCAWLRYVRCVYCTETGARWVCCGRADPLVTIITHAPLSSVVRPSLRVSHMRSDTTTSASPCAHARAASRLGAMTTSRCPAGT